MDLQKLLRIIVISDQRYAGIEGFAARWSPDGARIVFESDRSEYQKREVYIMNADGSDCRRITYSSSGITATDPVWMPNVP